MGPPSLSAAGALRVRRRTTTADTNAGNTSGERPCSRNLPISYLLSFFMATASEGRRGTGGKGVRAAGWIPTAGSMNSAR